MTPSGGANFKRHLNGFRTAGWAAFDREYREKQGIGVVGAVDPSSSISKNTFLVMESSNIVDSEKSLLSVQSMLTRSFSSVVQPSAVVEFPLLKAHTKNGTSNTFVDDDQHVATVKNKLTPVQMLKNVHIWADQYLIEDILAAVNNDVGQASILLKEMASFETEIKNMQCGPGMSSSADDVSNQSKDMNIILEKSGSFVDDNMPENSCKKIIIDKFYVPTEPEWEEDDVYLCHRKEALKLMRAASQHSRTASNAYLRGDHLSAQQLSSRAREERMTAEKLNAKAAKEILRIRNINNGIWKIDLHGLHATEAVHALIQHLQRLESDMTMSHSASPEVRTFDFSGGSKATSYAKGNTGPQQRQTLLHVITGTGNHSKGEASLPVAIKSFLIDQGYRFDEARPGIISVRPKFRYK